MDDLKLSAQSLNSLPDELKLNITARLRMDYMTLRSLALTCKGLVDVAQETLVHITIVDIEKLPLLVEVLSQKPRLGEKVRYLRFVCNGLVRDRHDRSNTWIPYKGEISTGAAVAVLAESFHFNFSIPETPGLARIPGRIHRSEVLFSASLLSAVPGLEEISFSHATPMSGSMFSELRGEDGLEQHSSIPWLPLWGSTISESLTSFDTGPDYDRCSGRLSVAITCQHLPNLRHLRIPFKWIRFSDSEEEHTMASLPRSFELLQLYGCDPDAVIYLKYLAPLNKLQNLTIRFLYETNFKRIAELIAADVTRWEISGLLQELEKRDVCLESYFLWWPSAEANVIDSSWDARSRSFIKVKDVIEFLPLKATRHWKQRTEVDSEATYVEGDFRGLIHFCCVAADTEVLPPDLFPTKPEFKTSKNSIQVQHTTELHREEPAWKALFESNRSFRATTEI
ncbi:hypothetical protein BDV96DRAFT_600685 [Lophiotrema nucula]|uniref:F-box domain-containing protein n=1 Tax=Lophiotrema nucula TaxID=690887 RepID=A0A6A5Z3E5_9PLEO|nr:hypothetical protein BDV96DRAFT_600685 [Lophiotrema nucula]